jgi:integrase
LNLTPQIIWANVSVSLKSRICLPYPSELPRFLAALNNASVRLETRLLIEWQLLTWVRPGEAVRARWSDIDMDNSMWNIPAEFMKMKKPHKVPLSKESLRILKSMESISGHREWVFPSIKAPLNHMHEQTANAAIIRMGLEVNLLPTECDLLQERQRKSQVSSGQMHLKRPLPTQKRRNYRCI